MILVTVVNPRELPRLPVETIFYSIVYVFCCRNCKKDTRLMPLNGSEPFLSEILDPRLDISHIWASYVFAGKSNIKRK